MPTKLESFAILADGGFRKVGEVHKDSSGITSEGLSSVYAESPMTAQTVSGIGSVGKQHTVATLLKLWDNELAAPESEKKWFVDGDDVGMDVKLKKFMPLLKEKYPDCLGFFNQIETYDYFDRITLADLVNHTHGLGARDNGKMSELILAGDGSPLPLSDIVKSSRKRTEKDVGISDSDNVWDKYGEMHYGNLGYDLAGMIIETITGKDFDRVVKETLLEPYGLNSTTTQSDHKSLYDSKTLRGENVDVAAGFAQQGDHGEINFNNLSNTRAAGGMKSTIADLERFAHLFMGGEMFESEQVKDAIAQRGGRSYHFAIEQNDDGTLGHKGDDTVFRSNLKFNPNTKEVEVELQVLENLTHHVSRKVFEKLYGSQKAKELDSAIVDSGFFPIFHRNGRPKPGGEKFNQLAQGLLEINPTLDQMVSDYTKIREIVVSHSTEALKENMGEIVDSITEDLSSKKESLVKKPGLQKRSTEQGKSFAERIAQRKSQSVVNEL